MLNFAIDGGSPLFLTTSGAYSKNFKYRSLAEECIQTLKYILVYLFLSCIVFPDFRTQYTLFLVNQSIMHCINSIMLMVILFDS